MSHGNDDDDDDDDDDDAASYCLAPSRALLRRRVSNVKRALAAVLALAEYTGK
ncbi:hypothetical protein K0M31_020110 [Melipona bicolor]|uniref:Uncharacterized protein n=1 Tax=Melipona bicolor TaxID=60889 RepID=A0AA40G0T2_9HYME|nr:hypothetical protein K0M31_020110 [Melipona bicolor]